MRFKSYIAPFVFVAALLFVACDKGFEELNINPNQPTVANPDYLFTETLHKGAGQFLTGVNTEIWTLQVWNQQMADINGVVSASDPYAYNGQWADQLWEEWYTKVLGPANEIVRITEGDPFLINKHSMARIWRVFAFHRITDLWGDVPYTEALNGVNPNGEPILMPAYDTQADIYEDLLNELKEAVVAMDAAQGSYGAADLLYGGDVDSWIRFGNSLRLRLAMRISSVNPGLAQQVVSELMADESSLMMSNLDGAIFTFNAEDPHPFYELELSGQGMRNPSHFLVELLNGLSDPRLAVYCEETPESQVLGTPPYVGVPNLLSSTDLNALSISEFSTSEVGNYWLNVNTPGELLTYAEVCFLKAEAALNGWGGGLSAQQYYDAGVTAAMEQLGVSSADITAYLSGAGAFDGTLESIITQKYISMVYRNGYEAFAELRRTGFPQLTDYNNNAVTNLPQRFAYPPSELTLNGSNVNAVGAGINETSTPVWWAQ